MDWDQLVRELNVLPEELAFWVREFADCGLAPSADGTFGTAAVQQAFFLKRLLREEGFTLWGAKRRLQRVASWDMPLGIGQMASERERWVAEAESRVHELIRWLDDILASRQG